MQPWIYEEFDDDSLARGSSWAFKINLLLTSCFPSLFFARKACFFESSFPLLDEFQHPTIKLEAKGTPTASLQEKKTDPITLSKEGRPAF